MQKGNDDFLRTTSGFVEWKAEKLRDNQASELLSEDKLNDLVSELADLLEHADSLAVHTVLGWLVDCAIDSEKLDISYPDYFEKAEAYGGLPVITIDEANSLVSLMRIRNFDDLGAIISAMLEAVQYTFYSSSAGSKPPTVTLDRIANAYKPKDPVYVLNYVRHREEPQELEQS